MQKGMYTLDVYGYVYVNRFKEIFFTRHQADNSAPLTERSCVTHLPNQTANVCNNKLKVEYANDGVRAYGVCCCCTMLAGSDGGGK